MDYSAANRDMWSLIITLGTVALALGAALFLRNRFSVIRKAMMPTAVLAGFLLLLLKETGLLQLNEEILEALVYHSIAMGFIALSLRKALRPLEKNGKRAGRWNGLKSGAIIVGTYLTQAFVGPVIWSLFLSTMRTRLPS